MKNSAQVVLFRITGWTVIPFTEVGKNIESLFDGGTQEYRN